MIEVEKLTKRYGRTTAVDHVSFTVGQGEIVGFLGPNGAGKTTTMRILSCYLPPSSGRVSIAGFDVVLDTMEVRCRIGYLMESVALYPEMRVVEYLRYRAALKGLHGRAGRKRVETVIEECGLGDERRSTIDRLSRGYRQRVGLADSLVHEPEVLLLDEPTQGLDPNQSRQVCALIRDLATRHTVLLSSHVLSEVESICSRVLILNEGRIVASDTTEHLRGMLQGNSKVIVEVAGPRDDVAAALQGIPGVLKVSHAEFGEWRQFVCECRRGSDLRAEIFRRIASGGWTLRELREERVNLEEIFSALTVGTEQGHSEPSTQPAV